MDIAEFTILTPFPHSPLRAKLEAENRILSNDWSQYTCDKVVFQPKQLSPEKLQELFHYAWDAFYKEADAATRMARLFLKVIHKEMKDGTNPDVGRRRDRKGWSAGGGGSP